MNYFIIIIICESLLRDLNEIKMGGDREMRIERERRVVPPTTVQGGAADSGMHGPQNSSNFFGPPNFLNEIAEFKFFF